MIIITFFLKPSHRQQIEQKTEGVGKHFSSCGGYEALCLQVIEVVTSDDLRSREDYWIQELKTKTPDGFNLRKESRSGF